MIERQLRSEYRSNYESLLTTQGLVGLQSRLLLGGEALNWQNNRLSELEENDFNNLDRKETTYQLLSQASTRERENYWQNKPETKFESQLQSWLDSTVRVFTQASAYFELPGNENWQIFFESLGINFRHFDIQEAKKLFHEYANTSGQSETTNYIDKVINCYRTESGINFEAIERDLEPITWLANIFGQISSETIRELIHAEAKLLDSEERQKLIAENNRDNRRNNLQIKEVAILNWLWPQSSQARVWQYYRKSPDDPQHFPFEQLSDQYLNNQFLAQELCDQNSEYASLGVEQIKEQMDLQEKLFESSLNSIGTTNQELEQILVEAMREYYRFLEEKYQVVLPKIKLHFLPIYGLKSALLNPEGQALGFVKGGLPIIFADYGVIQEHAKQYGYEHWGSISKAQLMEIMTRILKEVAPHELTHLLADMAFWQNTRNENNTIPEKWGTCVYKPTDFSNPNSDFVERGGGLMEACTVKMTTDWLSAMNLSVKVPAYPSEMRVLDELIEMIASENSLSEERAFKYFAHAYFLPGKLLELSKVLSGKNRVRPHFLSIVYALMDFEADRHVYPLTLGYIKGELNNEQKRQIYQQIDQLNLTPRIKRFLLTQL